MLEHFFIFLNPGRQWWSPHLWEQWPAHSDWSHQLRPGQMYTFSGRFSLWSLCKNLPLQRVDRKQDVQSSILLWHCFSWHCIKETLFMIKDYILWLKDSKNLSNDFNLIGYVILGLYLANTWSYFVIQHFQIFWSMNFQ